MADWVIRGVPRALVRDMWWFSASPEGVRGPGELPQDRDGTRPGKRAAALLGLVALADWLFFGQAVGLSLAIFAGAVLAVVITLAPGRERLRPALVLVIAALPVVDYAQALSLGILAAGLVVSVLWATGGTEALGRRAAALMSGLPLRAVRDGTRMAREVSRARLMRDQRSALRGQSLRAWAFPLGGALVLAALLVEANPVLGDIAVRLVRLDIGAGSLDRVLFWTGAALLIWPMIAPAEVQTDRPLRLPLVQGPSAGSVARGLVLFNAILAVQTLMDAVYLWFGAALPEGMTAAEYAHRGAYPLLATALLAGAFALVARPFAAEDRRLRALLLLWLAQNVALTLSALLRLDLYVDAFGLTYLRIHAAIWMALVAAGLGLTAWQVWRGLPNRWLLVRSVGLGAGVLYACAFVNFAAIIARENLTRAAFDGGYVCGLGPMAAAEIAASGRMLRAWSDDGYDYGPCRVERPRIDGWRDWGFRNWQVGRYLDGLAEGGHEDPHRG